MDKQELPINNPAERLYVILTRAAESSPESSIEDVLCKAMELKSNSENFIRGFSELMTLLEKIEEQIQFFSTPKQKGYLALTKNIRKNLLMVIRFVGLNDLNDINNNKYLWKNVGELSDPNSSTLQFLAACAADFEERGISINKDLLNELINDVEAWLLEIQKSEFDESVKEFLISTFMEIKNLLEKYYDCGSHRIESEILAAIAKITLCSKNLTEENKSFFTKSSEKLLKMVDLFIKPASAYFLGQKLFSEAIRPIMTEVIDKAQHLLPPGS